MTQPAGWPKRLTRVIATQVQNARSQRKMSAQQLADATAALGYEIPRSVIANLESGRRDTVSIAELLVLAKALRVPPLLLVFPLGQEQLTEVLPGTTMGTWAAARWFTGEGSFLVQMPDGEWAAADFDEWRDAATSYFREQDAMFAEWNRTRSRVRTALTENDEEGAQFAQRMLRRVEDELRRHREGMRKVGLDPGGLNSTLAHIEGDDDGQR
jgi:transcriptional regulator with XRE-family HTH domain